MPAKLLLMRVLKYTFFFRCLKGICAGWGRAGGSNLGIFGDGKVSRGDWFNAGKGMVGCDLSGYRRSRGPLLNNLSS